MNIEEFLRHQESASVEMQAIVEAVADNPSKVRITPYRQGQGCNCSDAIELDKQDVEDIEVTQGSAWCCGRQFKIANVKIRSTARLPVADVLARSMSRDIGAPPRPPPCDQDSEPCCHCNEEYGWCIRSGRPRAQCYRELQACMKTCLGV
jgi:hypothetical protein